MEKNIIIYHTNDTHARISTLDDNERSIGLDKISKLVNKTLFTNKHSFLFSAGDILHGTPRININPDSIVDLLNPTALNAMVTGNHDYNFGLDHLYKLSKNLNAYILSANTVDKETGVPLLLPYVIYELDLLDDDYLDIKTANSNDSKNNNLKIGVFGLSTPETAYKTNPENVKNVTFLNPITVAKNMISVLEKTCDIIITLTHLGLDESSEFTSKRLAEEVAGMDLVIDGHSHSELSNGMVVNNTLIVQAGSHGHFLGKVTLTVDVDKKQIINKKAKLLNEAAVDKLINSETDAFINNRLNELDKRTNNILNTPITTSPFLLSADRSIVRCKESELGNFIADIIRSSTSSDVAVINGGNLRSDFVKGNISRKTILDIFPFNESIVVTKITGSVLKAVVEHSTEFMPAAFGGFLHFSGLTVKINANLPGGKRVQKIEVNNLDLDEEKEYTVAVTDFMTSGGDDYSMLKDCTIIKNAGLLDGLVINWLSQPDWYKSVNFAMGRIELI